MNIILCNKNNFCYFEDYIYSIIDKIKGQIVLFQEDININFSDKNNYIFIQNIDNKFFEYIEKNNNIYLINTEQLSVEKTNIRINTYPQNLIFIDYISSNFKYYNIKYKKYILPYQINYNEIFNYKKENDVCLIGTINNIPNNRQNIINLLKEKNINVDIISGFGKNRDINLFKYKILLNIGYYPNNCNIMETFRCDRCVYNNMIVVSDIKEDIEDYCLKEFVIFTDYTNIPEKVKEILDNYEEFYNKLFSKFKLEDINLRLINLSNKLIEKINLDK
jgi:hypothetical protein